MEVLPHHDKKVAAADDKRHHKLLKEWSRLPENAYCADCNAKNMPGTGWCSVNLGIFICYTCAGQPRGLGVHISQVRSCNMDSFFKDQMEVMRQVGKARARAIWEANVPPSFEVPDSKSNPAKIADWIKDKYQHKRSFKEADDPTQVTPRVHAAYEWPLEPLKVWETLSERV